MVSQGRFGFPRGQVVVTTCVLQNFEKDSVELHRSTLNTLVGEVFGEGAETEVVTRGKKKRDDVRVVLMEPGVPLDDMHCLQERFRAALARDGSCPLSERAARIDLVPEQVRIAGQPPPPPSGRTSDLGSAGAVVVDTDVISRFLKGNPTSQSARTRHQTALMDWLTKVHQGRKVMSWQTRAELYAWITLRSFSKERLEALEALLSDYEVVEPVDELTCLVWAGLINYTRAQGRPAGAQDLWVAATALAMGAPLCTYNIADYEYLPGVTIVDVDTDLEGVEGAPPSDPTPSDSAPCALPNGRGGVADEVENGVPVAPSATLAIQECLRSSFTGTADEFSTSDLLAELMAKINVRRSTVCPSLFHFNTRHNARSTAPLENACRGLILDSSRDWAVVCYPLNAFFNAGERTGRDVEEAFDWPSCVVYPKLDGSLVCLWWHGGDGKWHVSTRGDPDASMSYIEHNTIHKIIDLETTFTALFWRTFQRLGYRCPVSQEDKHRCYFFELLTEENRVVVPVPEGKPQLVLLGGRDLDTLVEMSPASLQATAHEFGWKVIEPLPRPKSGWDLEKVKRLVENLSCTEGEGYVCCDHAFRRLKVKSKSYVAASHLPRPNWGLPSPSTERSEAIHATINDSRHNVTLMKLVLAGEHNEFMAYFPDWAARLDGVNAALSHLCENIFQIVRHQQQGNIPGKLVKDVTNYITKKNLSDASDDAVRNAIREYLSMRSPSQVLEWCGEIPQPVGEIGDEELSADMPSNEPSRIKLDVSALVNGAERVRVLARNMASDFTTTPSAMQMLGGLFRNGSQRVVNLIKGSGSSSSASQVDKMLHDVNERLYGGFYKDEVIGRIVILEDFLRRLSADAVHRDTMVMLGSMLTRQFVWPHPRSSSDLDFMAWYPWDSSDPVNNVVRRLKDIILRNPGDGLVNIDVQSIKGHVHWEETDQPGVKCELECTLLQGWQCAISIDVAFGDPMMPFPFWIEYKPVPFAERGAEFSVLAVRPEMLFAWKLHGLFEHNIVDELGRDVQGQWRPKDIHDIWLFSRYMRPDLNFDVKKLPMSIDIAFLSRHQSSRRLVMRVLKRKFGSSAGSQRNWRTYRRKCANPDEIPVHLHQVVGDIADFLKPLLGYGDGDGEENGGFVSAGFSEAMKPTSSVEEVEIFGKASRSEKRLKQIQERDGSGMILPLPGRFYLHRMDRRVEFKPEHEGGDAAALFEELKGMMHAKGDDNANMLATVRFIGREDEFEVEKVVAPSQKRRFLGKQQDWKEIVVDVPGYLQLRQHPTFTARECTGECIIRRQEASNKAEGARTANNETQAELDPETKNDQEAQLLNRMKERESTQGRSLARRLDVLQPIDKLGYVTSSKLKFMETIKCLAEWQQNIVHVADLKPPMTARLDPELAAERMVRYCYSVLCHACFVDITFLEIEEDNGGRSVYFDPIDGDETDGTDSKAFSVYDHLGKKAVLRTFVALCRPAGKMSPGAGEALVQVFEGNIDGRILHDAPADMPRTLSRSLSVQETQTWNRVFVPDGFDRTLDQLGSSRFCLGVRYLPLLELAQNLRDREYTQVFEVHITVITPKEDSPMTRFSQVCEDLSKTLAPSAERGAADEDALLKTALRPVMIENDRGENPKQMMTASHHVGTLPQVHLVAFRLSQELIKLGYSVSRTKIEALMSNRGVPITDDEARRLSPENYFEFHVKLRLPPDVDLDSLREYAAAHDAHLSRSASKALAHGWHKRFVNMRMYGIGRETALERLNNCVEGLRKRGHIIDRIVREYAVYDSNVSLDKGWIDKKV